MNNSTVWTELFRGKASIYALNENTKQWLDRGTSGAFVMFLNNNYKSDVRIKWEKHGNQFWWRLMNGKLKPKGPRAWVLKAWATHNNAQEILAIRFSNEQMSSMFYQKYNSVFPQPQQRQQPQQPQQFQARVSNAHLNSSNPYQLKNRNQKESSKWECAVCTFRNGSSRSTCEMCGLPKNDSEKNAQSHLTYTSQDLQKVLPLVPDLSYSKSQKSSIQPKSYYPNVPAQQPQPQYGMQKQPQQNRQPYMPNMPFPRQPQNSFAQQAGWNRNGNMMMQQQQQQQRWQCPICNVFNISRAVVCAACNTSRVLYHNNGQMGMGMGAVGGLGAMGSMGPYGLGSVANNQWMNPMQMRYQNSNVQGQGQNGYAPPPMQVNQAGFGIGNIQQQWMQAKKFKNPNDMQKMAQFVSKEMNRLGQTKQSNQVSTELEFQNAASYIASYNRDPFSIFKTLKSVSSKLQKDDMRYRTLDTTNPKVMERLIGYEGVLEFLMLLGFESDKMGMKLVCKTKPSLKTVENATLVLDSYVVRLGIGRMAKKEDVTGDDPKMNDVGSDYLDSFGTTCGGPSEYENDNGGDDEDSLTLEQIIVWTTHDAIRDYGSMETLLLTHRTFTDSVALIRQLTKRFFVPVPLNIRSDPVKAQEFRNTVQKSIQLKVLKSIRDWMKKYWEEDFAHDKEVQNELRQWLQEMNRRSTEAKYLVHFAKQVTKEFERYLQTGAMKKKVAPLDLSKSVVTGRKKIISNFTEIDIAEQITLMDFRRFSRIEPRECLGQAWKKKNGKTTAPNICAMIQNFNDLTSFVQIQILREKSLKLRVKSLRRIIKMGQRFEELNNYYSLCAIYSSLNASCIHRLKHAWALLDKKQIAIVEHFNELYKHSYNHRNLRAVQSNCAPPSVPHIGLFLQDLVFIDDGNAKMINIDNFAELGGGRHNNMVNFNKCVRCADRIKSIKLYQEHPFTDIKQNLDLQILLTQEFEKVKQITEDEMWDMSSEIKAADERESKKGFLK